MQHESRSNAPLETVRTEEKQAYVKDITESKVQEQTGLFKDSTCLQK